jgi:hypothetical protein
VQVGTAEERTLEFWRLKERSTEGTLTGLLNTLKDSRRGLRNLRARKAFYSPSAERVEGRENPSRGLSVHRSSEGTTPSRCMRRLYKECRSRRIL